MSNNSMDFTTGSITKALFKFSLPFFLTNLIQSFYNIVDIMVISRFCGKEGVAGVSIGGNVTMTVTFIIIGLCSGGAIMTSQYVGMHREEDVKETIGTTFGVMLILSVLSTFFTLVFADNILSVLNTPTEAFTETRSYFSICMIGSIFIFGYNSTCSILQGLGDSRTPMYFGVVSCLLNIILDVIFVGMLKLNSAGAAIATVLSQSFSAIGCIVYLKINNFIFDFKPKSFRIYPDKAINILKLGLPGAFQSAVVSGGFLIVSSITNSIGVSAASGVATAAKVNNFAQMPASAIGTSVSSMVGQNVGAEKYERASLTMKTGILISLIIGIAMFTIVQLFPTQLMGFIVNDTDIIQTALPYLRVTAFDYLLVALIFPLNGLCNGSGHTMFTMIPSICSSVIARVPVAYFCTRTLGLGLAGVGISTPTGTISAIIICTAYYLSGKWKRKTI